MARALALLAALAGAALAAGSTTTVSLLLPLMDPQKIVGSVVKADSTITTFAFACAPDTPAESCGLPGSQTLAQGPSTWIMTLALNGKDSGAYTQDVNCKLDAAKDVATCHASVSQQDPSSGTFQSEASSVLTGYSSLLLPVTITAGVDKLTATPGATARGTNTNAAPTASTQAAGSGTGSSPTSTQTGTNKGTLPASTSTSSGNAAGPMVTQKAVLAGVAAVVGGAMML
ncbi:hypothetical protein TOPH_02286 [Tolypocladium ophioglossoides CBS 100239]|uniref:Uncharacterized protein n=1 Tax=Tolypocladium ophioglossoides (strain CBS 100239) TaxID=1163406 RepID=A0A0L0NH91_TOLOC|nr:hypothetical protein TOPH_02286 [Tolypocladium ophioglossoides CBS 100239]